MTTGHKPDVRTQIQMIFMEMPEMRLTRGQVRRLLDVPAEACERALVALVQNGFLIESIDGVLARGTSRASLFGHRADPQGAV